MPETPLPAPVARSAFQGLLNPGRHGRAEGVAGVVALERTGLSVVSIMARSGQAAATVAAVRSTLGLELPSDARRTQAGRVAALWAGPAQWFVTGEPPEAAGLEARLVAALDGTAAIAEVGDGRAVLRLSGPRVREVLAKGTGIDLHPSVFGPGRTALTMVSMIDVQITQVDEAPTFELMLFRGFAGSFWHWLEESAAPEGLAVVAEG